MVFKKRGLGIGGVTLPTRAERPRFSYTHTHTHTHTEEVVGDGSQALPQPGKINIAIYWSRVVMSVCAERGGGGVERPGLPQRPVKRHLDTVAKTMGHTSTAVFRVCLKEPSQRG